MSKLLHILGGGTWQIPSIVRAQALGYKVLLTDMYEERPGYDIADYHEQVNLVDSEATLKVAQKYKIDGIICDTTDVGVPTMAYVAEKMGLPGIGIEVAHNFTSKYRMRELTSKAGLDNPPFIKTNSVSAVKKAGFDIPFVVKPIDSQSSRGVHVIRDASRIEELAKDALNCSRSGEIIAEGFLDGIEVTVESAVINSEVFLVGISDKDHYKHRPEVANRLTYPADFPPHVLSAIERVNRQVIQVLGLKTGITHAEYMIVGEKPYLVEIAARGAGSYVYTDIVPYLAGAKIPEAYIKWVLGGEFDAIPDGVSRSANLQFFDFPSGKVTAIKGVEEARALPGVHELLLEFAVGDTILPPHDDRSRVGLAVLFGTTRADVLTTTAKLLNLVKVTVV